MGKEQNHE